MATKPSEMVPLRMALRVVPTRSSSPSTSAIVRTAPNCSGIYSEIEDEQTQTPSRHTHTHAHTQEYVYTHTHTLANVDTQTHTDIYIFFLYLQKCPTHRVKMNYLSTANSFHFLPLRTTRDVIGQHHWRYGLAWKDEVVPTAQLATRDSMGGSEQHTVENRSR